MIRFPISAGSASTATNFTIAFATFADVIAVITGIYCYFLSFLVSEGGPGLFARNIPPGEREPENLELRPLLHASQALGGYSRDLFTDPVQFLGIHARPHLVQIDPTLVLVPSFLHLSDGSV